MKRVHLFIIPVLLVGFLAGCSSSNTPVTPGETITLNESYLTLDEGNTFQLTADTKSTLTWSSDHPEYASVDQNGLVTAISEGTTAVYARTASAKARFLITVNHVAPEDYHEVNKQNQNATKVTIGELLNKTQDGVLYRITGIVEQNTYQTVGVFDISDETGYIEVYGCGSVTSCISSSGGKYTYTEGKSYSTLSNQIKAGDEVTLEGILTLYTSYQTVKEFQGYVVGYTNKNQKIPSISYTSGDTYSGDYYQETDLTKSGTQLMKNLQTLMFNTHNFSSMNYASLYWGYGKTGECTNNLYTCYYTNKTYSKSSMNREHVWCQSLSIGYPGSSDKLWGETGGGCDLHHVRPANASVNSIRSNRKFGQLLGKKSSTVATDYSTSVKYTGTAWEVPDDIKGDTARILLYVYMHYNSAFSTETRTYTGALALRCIVASVTDEEALSILKYWNAIDPVDDIEKARNEGAYIIQGNRNPFIDYPTLVDRL